MRMSGDEKKELAFKLIKGGVGLKEFAGYHEEYHKHYCDYSEPWQGPCGRSKEHSAVAVLSVMYGEETYHLCEKHSKTRCKCGKQAVRGCSNSGQFVCGAPLCPNCECDH